MNRDTSLRVLRDDFLATSTQSMPIAGMIFWGLVAVASLYIQPVRLSYLVLFGSGMIFPFGALLDLIFFKRMSRSSTANPVTQSFLQSLALVVLLWPLVIIGARQAHAPILIVLGAAILMGIIWVPYGWAADDPIGMQHAVGRCVLSYAAYLFAPEPYKSTAIASAVLLSYLYSFVRMRRPSGSVMQDQIA